MRNQVTLTIIAVCLLLGADLILVYGIYAQTDNHPLKAEARVWVDTGKGHCKASVNAPLSSCAGYYNMTVEVAHGQNKYRSGNFSGAITKSVSTSGAPSASNYAGAYISDSSFYPHNGETASKTDHGN